MLLQCKYHPLIYVEGCICDVCPIIRKNKKIIKNIIQHLLIKHDTEYVMFCEEFIDKLLENISHSDMYMENAFMICAVVEKYIEKNKQFFDEKIEKINDIKKFCEINKFDYETIKKVPHVYGYIHKNFSMDHLKTGVANYLTDIKCVRSIPYNNDIYRTIDIHNKYRSPFEEFANRKYCGDVCLCGKRSSWFCIISNKCAICCDCCKNNVISKTILEKYYTDPCLSKYYKINYEIYYHKKDVIEWCNEFIKNNGTYGQYINISKCKKFLCVEEVKKYTKYNNFNLKMLANVDGWTKYVNGKISLDDFIKKIENKYNI